MRNWRPPDVPSIVRVPIGRIRHISVFGEVDVDFNTTSEFESKTFNRLSDIRNSFIKIYIKPSEDWDIWTE